MLKRQEGVEELKNVGALEADYSIMAVVADIESQIERQSRSC